MRPFDFLIVTVSVALSSLSQIVLKRGMTSSAMQATLKSGGPMEVAVAVATSPLVLGGLTCFGLSAVVWLFVLSQIPLSQAYPFVALGIVVTVTAGTILFGETVTAQSLAGVVLIVTGVILVGLAR